MGFSTERCQQALQNAQVRQNAFRSPLNDHLSLFARLPVLPHHAKTIITHHGLLLDTRAILKPHWRYSFREPMKASPFNNRRVPRLVHHLWRHLRRCFCGAPAPQKLLPPHPLRQRRPNK